MARFTMFQRPVTRTEHKRRMLHMMRCITERNMRGSPVHKYQQLGLLRNRLNISWTHPKMRAMVARHEQRFPLD